MSVLPWSLGNRSNVTSRIETHFQAIRETFFQKGCINFKFQLRLLSRPYIHVNLEEFCDFKYFAYFRTNNEIVHKNKATLFWKFQLRLKVIYRKYTKHWSYLLAYTMDCDCSKILSHGLNHGLFLSLLQVLGVKIHSKLNWKIRIKI